MSSPCHGRVIWVRLADPQGHNAKSRPAVILTLTDEIEEGGDVWVVGASTSFELAPAEAQIELQFDPRGNCRSGLRERCWAVSTWVAQVSLLDVEEYAGVIPGRQMAEIRQKIGALPTEGEQ